MRCGKGQQSGYAMLADGAFPRKTVIFISNNDEGNDSFQKQSVQYPSPIPEAKSYPFTSFQIPWVHAVGLLSTLQPNFLML